MVRSANAMGGNTQQVTMVNEKRANRALIRLISPGEHGVYFLTGHGELTLKPAGKMQPGRRNRRWNRRITQSRS
jgi:hypothetical protein